MSSHFVPPFHPCERASDKNVHVQVGNLDDVCAAAALRAGPTSVRVDHDTAVKDVYTFGGQLGAGMQGVVFEGTHKVTGERVAIKSTHIGPFAGAGTRAAAYTELETLSHMHHPNVLRLMGAYQCPTELNLVLTHIDGYMLIRYLVEVEKEGHSPVEEAKEKHMLLKQLVDAVGHIHANGVVYRDLQPKNIMVSRSRPRVLTVIDFGRAIHLDRSDRIDKARPMGTSLFQAPEVEKRAAYGQQADMWAVGVVMYLLISGKMAFAHSVSGLYKAGPGTLAAQSDSI